MTWVEAQTVNVALIVPAETRVRNCAIDRMRFLAVVPVVFYHADDVPIAARTPARRLVL